MRFEEIKAYREHKIININLIEKEKINIKIENLISFLKVGEKYYIKDIKVTYYNFIIWILTLFLTRIYGKRFWTT